MGVFPDDSRIMGNKNDGRAGVVIQFFGKRVEMFSRFRSKS